MTRGRQGEQLRIRRECVLTSADERTLVQIASRTKAVPATALAMLVDADALAWDDPVHRHIPELALADAHGAESAGRVGVCTNAHFSEPHPFQSMFAAYATTMRAMDAALRVHGRGREAALDRTTGVASGMRRP